MASTGASSQIRDRVNQAEARLSLQLNPWFKEELIKRVSTQRKFSPFLKPEQWKRVTELLSDWTYGDAHGHFTSAGYSGPEGIALSGGPDFLCLLQTTKGTVGPILRQWNHELADYEDPDFEFPL